VPLTTFTFNSTQAGQISGSFEGGNLASDIAPHYISEIQTLIVTGPLDNADFLYMTDTLSINNNVREFNLSGASIVGNITMNQILHGAYRVIMPKGDGAGWVPHESMFRVQTVEPDITQIRYLDISGMAGDIPDSLFLLMTNLEEIVLPDRLIRIGDFSFGRTDNLSTIDLRRVTHIGQDAFRVSNLHTIRFSNIESIRSGAFTDNINLREMHFDVMTAPINPDDVSLGAAFRNIAYGAVIYHPYGATGFNAANFADPLNEHLNFEFRTFLDMPCEDRKKPSFGGGYRPGHGAGDCQPLTPASSIDENAVMQAGGLTATVGEEAGTVPAATITPPIPPTVSIEPFHRPSSDVPLVGPDQIVPVIAEVPMGFQFVVRESWSLVNFILSIATGVLAVMMCVRTLTVKKRKDEDMGYVNDWNNRSRPSMMVAIAIMAVAGATLYILTQNKSFGMVVADHWTPAHVILFVGSIFCHIFANSNDEGNDTLTPASS